MASNKFRVIYITEEAQLGDLIKAVAPTSGIVLESVSKIGEHTGVKHRYAGGKKNKGISAEDLVIKLLSAKKTPTSFAVLQQGLVEVGFSPNSLGATLSRMKNEGKVVKVGNSDWALPKGK